jgi:hypothetical protein
LRTFDCMESPTNRSDELERAPKPRTTAEVIEDHAVQAFLTGKYDRMELFRSLSVELPGSGGGVRWISYES